MRYRGSSARRPRHRRAQDRRVANSLEPYMDGRLLVERVNAPFLYEHRGTPTEYGAGIERAIENG